MLHIIGISLQIHFDKNNQIYGFNYQHKLYKLLKMNKICMDIHTISKKQPLYHNILLYKHNFIIYLYYYQNKICIKKESINYNHYIYNYSLSPINIDFLYLCSHFCKNSQDFYLNCQHKQYTSFHFNILSKDIYIINILQYHYHSILNCINSYFRCLYLH